MYITTLLPKWEQKVLMFPFWHVRLILFPKWHGGDDMQRANQDIRSAIMTHRLRQWEVAEAVGISDSRLSVWLRTPLRADRKKRVLDAIDKLTKQPA